MKKLIIIGLIILLGFGIGVWIYQYLNPADTVVNEEIPAFEVETAPANTSDSVDQGTSSISEPAPVVEIPEPVRLSGEFEQGDASYTIDGSVIVTQQDSERLLSLAEFSVTSGPDLFVYIVQTEDASNQGVKEAVERGNFVNIAPLKGNVGSQNYQIPEDVDLDGVVISIWCKQFSRNFGHAAL